MKTQTSKVRANRVSRFHYKSGVEYRTKNRRVLWSFLSLTIMLGFGGLLATHTSLAKDFYSKTMNRQAHAVTLADPAIKSQSSDLASAPKLPTQDKQLAKKIAAKLDTFPDSQKWSVYVQDIETDRSVAIDADSGYEPASFYKLFLLAPLESKFPTEKWSTRIQGRTLKSCIDLMLRLSDNACGQAIGTLVNWSYADTFNESIGISKTRLASGVGGTTTAREVGELFVNLRKGEILTDKARRQVFDSLYGQKHTTGIPAGCTNCRVANKTGDINGFVHDGGVITHGKDSYVLVIMSKGGNFDQIADLTRTIDAEMYP